MWETFELFSFLWLLTIKPQTQTSCPITNHPHSAKPGCTLQPWMQRPGRCWLFNCLSIAVSCCDWNMGNNRGKPGSDVKWGLRHIAGQATESGGGWASRKLSWNINKREFLFVESGWFTGSSSLLQANSDKNKMGKWKMKEWCWLSERIVLSCQPRHQRLLFFVTKKNNSGLATEIWGFSFYHYVNPLLCVIWGFLCQSWWLLHTFNGEKKVTFKKKKLYRIFV